MEESLRYRQIGQKILDIFTNMGAKTKVTDSQSGFRALSLKALDNLDFKSDGYNVESDMISHFSAQGLSIMEVPISVSYDVPNKHKKHPVTHGVGVLTRLITLVGYRRPLLLFGLPGGCFVIGWYCDRFFCFQRILRHIKVSFWDVDGKYAVAHHGDAPGDCRDCS